MERASEGAREKTQLVSRSRILGLRDVHEELLVAVGSQLRLWVEALGPGLLDDGLACAVVGCIESGDFVKVDVLVQRKLQRGCYVVGVIMVLAMMVMMMTIIVLVVAVRHVGVFGRDTMDGVREEPERKRRALRFDELLW